MRILISGYYGFGNVGDEAVLESIIQEFRKVQPDIEMVVLSALPRVTSEIYGVKAIHRYDWLKVFLNVIKADVVVSGGGTLFQDATSNRSFWYYIGIVILAKLLRKKVAVFGQGFGPLRSKLNQKLIRLVLNRVDLITLRDEGSFNKLSEMGIKKSPMVVTGDPSVLLEPPDSIEGRKILSLEGIPTDRVLLGISVRNIPKHPELENKVFFMLAESLDYLVKKYNYQPVFLLLQCPEDIREVSKVINLMKEKSNVIFRICRPKEILSLVSCFDLLIGMRLHSLIFATMNAVPMLGISYDPKVEAFMKLIEQPSIKVDQAEKLYEVLEEILARKESIKKDLESKREMLRARAALNFELFFATFEKVVK